MSPTKVLAHSGFWGLVVTLLGLNVWWAWEWRPLPELAPLRAAVQQGRQEEAEAGLRALLARSPRNSEARVLLARCLAAQGDVLGAAEQLHEVPVWAPNKAEARFREAQSYLEVDRAADAEVAFLACIEDDPLHPTPPEIRADAGLELIKIYVVQRRVKDAQTVIWAEYNLTEPVNRPIILSMRLRLELEQIALQEVISILNRYVTADPDDWQSHRALAKTYQDLGRPADADRHLTAALAIEPEEPLVWRDRLHILYERGDLDALTIAVEELPPGSKLVPDLWMFLGIIRDRAGDLPGAAEAYRMAVRLDPHIGQYHYLLAMVEARLGRPELAQVHLERNRELREAFAALRGAYNDFLIVTGVLPQPADSEAPDRAESLNRLEAICRTLGWDRSAEALVEIRAAGEKRTE